MSFFIVRSRCQVVKATVCKTVIRGFESHRDLKKTLHRLGAEFFLWLWWVRTHCCDEYNKREKPRLEAGICDHNQNIYDWSVGVQPLRIPP